MCKREKIKFSLRKQSIEIAVVWWHYCKQKMKHSDVRFNNSALEPMPAFEKLDVKIILEAHYILIVIEMIRLWGPHSMEAQKFYVLKIF